MPPFIGGVHKAKARQQGRRKESFKGGGIFLNAIFQKGSFYTDLFHNTLNRKCIKLLKWVGVGVGGGGSSDLFKKVPFTLISSITP